jgi:hypothetical protein
MRTASAINPANIAVMVRSFFIVENLFLWIQACEFSRQTPISWSSSGENKSVRADAPRVMEKRMGKRMTAKMIRVNIETSYKAVILMLE